MCSHDHIRARRRTISSKTALYANVHLEVLRKKKHNRRVEKRDRVEGVIYMKVKPYLALAYLLEAAIDLYFQNLFCRINRSTESRSRTTPTYWLCWRSTSISSNLISTSTWGILNWTFSGCMWTWRSALKEIGRRTIRLWIWTSLNQHTVIHSRCGFIKTCNGRTHNILQFMIKNLQINLTLRGPVGRFP